MVDSWKPFSSWVTVSTRHLDDRRTGKSFFTSQSTCAPGSRVPIGVLTSDLLAVWLPFSGSYLSLNISADPKSTHLLVAASLTTVAT